MRIKHLIAAVLAFLMVCTAAVDPIAGKIFPAVLAEETVNGPETGETETPDETEPEAQPEEPVWEFADSDTFCEARGDVDRDGSVTAADARLALRFAVQLETPEEEDVRRGDYNLSSTLDAADARLILRVAVGLEITPRHVSAGNVTMEEATCLSSGKVGKRCIFCNRFYDVGILPPMEHKSAGWTIEKNATCTDEGFMKQVCIYCGVEISSVVTPKRPHVWDEDHPVFIEKEPDCTRVQTVEYTCMICGAKTTGSNKIYKTHDYVWVEIVAPTCTEKGYEERQCSRCGMLAPGPIEENKRMVPSLGGHTPVWITQSEPNATLPGHRINRCTKCQTVLEEEDILFEPGKHSFDMQHPVFLDENPDCTEMQSVEYTCLDCGEKRVSLRLPSKSHNYTWFVTDEPTCTKTGEQEERCARCDRLSGKPNETLAKLPHQSAGWTVIAGATCASEGLQEEYCAVCGELIGTKRLPKTAHDYDRAHPRFVDEDPDCTKRQNVEYACVNCGATVLEEWEPLDEHQFDWVAHIEPTCTEEGRAHRECLVCGKMSASNLTRVLNPLGHDPDWEHVRFLDENPDCTVAQKVECVCLRCGETVEVDWEPKEAHEWVWVTEIEPTCTVDGREYEACAVCGKRKNNLSRVITALGHDPYWATLYQPTETEPGLEIYLCRRCGDVLDQREIPAPAP